MDKYVQTLLYKRVTEFYTLNKGEKIWNRRKQQSIDEGIIDSIRRIYSISPVHVKLNALRLLLNNICGPKSNEELRTIQGKVYDTFLAAAIARDLIKDDKI